MAQANSPTCTWFSITSSHLHLNKVTIYDVPQLLATRRHHVWNSCGSFHMVKKKSFCFPGCQNSHISAIKWIAVAKIAGLCKRKGGENTPLQTWTTTKQVQSWISKREALGQASLEAAPSNWKLCSLIFKCGNSMAKTMYLAGSCSDVLSLLLLNWFHSRAISLETGSLARLT